MIPQQCQDIITHLSNHRKQNWKDWQEGLVGDWIVSEFEEETDRYLGGLRNAFELGKHTNFKQGITRETYQAVEAAAWAEVVGLELDIRAANELRKKSEFWWLLAGN